MKKASNAPARATEDPAAVLEGRIRKILATHYAPDVFELVATTATAVALARVERGPRNEKEFTYVELYAVTDKTGVYPAYIGKRRATIHRADANNEALIRIAQAALKGIR